MLSQRPSVGLTSLNVVTIHFRRQPFNRVRIQSDRAVLLSTTVPVQIRSLNDRSRKTYGELKHSPEYEVVPSRVPYSRWSFTSFSMLAGGISTFDSIGSSLAAVFTRDLYARFLVRNRDDRHYLLVSRISTFLLIAISFAYVPFMSVGMVEL